MKTTLILASLAAVAAASAQDIGVNVNGRPLAFDGAQPAMVNNSVLVPLRGIFERLGADVKWNQQAQEVTAIKGDKRIRLVIGQRFADVSGRSVQLTTPAQVVKGTTLVPLRFVSEALGAVVLWKPDQMLVQVNTNGNGRAQELRNGDSVRADRTDRDVALARRIPVVTLFKSTVIPVKLTSVLSSNESRQGDKFDAVVDAKDGIYSNIPNGTKIQGRVISAKRQDGDQPGTIELAFDRIVLPDGSTEDMSGTLVSLDDKNLKSDADGRIVATGKAKDNKAVYAGYGAGAGAIISVLSKDNTKGTVSKTLLGGLLGAAAGALEKGKKNPTDVRLGESTRFGVRLDEDLAIYRKN